MNNDNMYPNNGEYFTGFKEPKSQKEERENEKKEVERSQGALEKVVKHLEERISFYDSISSIPDNVMDDREQFMRTVAVNKQTQLNLRQELEPLKSMISTIK